MGEKKRYYQKKRRRIGMKQRWKKSIAYIMSFCMLFGIMQTAAWVTPVYAETADGEVDESQEGIHSVRYLTGDSGKQFTDTDTSPESHTDRLTDFIAETQSMTWSVEFQTTDTRSGRASCRERV